MKKLRKVHYRDLDARQQESYNFQKASALLADYGFTTIRLTSDWEGADFIAQHVDGKTFLKVQLKGRLHFAKKYTGRDLHLCFRDLNDWYLCPHDRLLETVLRTHSMGSSVSWRKRGGYSFPRLSKELRKRIARWRL